MDLRFTPEEVAFREEVRTFIQDNLPREIRERMRLGYPPRKQDTIAWMRILNAKGWAAYSWPKEYGGGGFSPIERVIWQQEEGAYWLLSALFMIGHGMCGPTIITWGNEAQKQACLPPQRAS